MKRKSKTVRVDPGSNVKEVVVSAVSKLLAAEKKQRYARETVDRVMRSRHVADHLEEQWDMLDDDYRSEIAREIQLAVQLAGIPIPPMPWVH